MRRAAATLVAVLALAPVSMSGAEAQHRAQHYTANTSGDEEAAAAAGFNVLDVTMRSTGAATKTAIDGLPAGTRALVWAGNLDNETCGLAGSDTSQATFDANVRSAALGADPKLFGYYLSDEPHPYAPAYCSTAASDIRSRADEVHQFQPGKMAFIVVEQSSAACPGPLVAGCEFAALNPSQTHVDAVGIDPYPCHYASDGITPEPCDVDKIGSKVNLANANGVTDSKIVPVFQAFGQSGCPPPCTPYYRTPSASKPYVQSEEGQLIQAWYAVVPHPIMTYAYSWGVQCDEVAGSCSAPQAIQNTPSLRSLLAYYNSKF
jgi:hypothetical protein